MGWDPFQPYVLAGAAAGEQARLRKAELAALMQRFRETKDLEERQFGHTKDVYERSQQEAARARAEQEFSQQFDMLPTEATLAQPSSSWHPPQTMPGFDRPKLLTGKDGQPTGVGTERVDKYREMGGPARESLVKSFVAAGKAGTPQQGEAVIESLLRSRREKAYAGMGRDYAKQVSDPEWARVNLQKRTVGQNDAQFAFGVYKTLKADVQSIEQDEYNVANAPNMEPEDRMAQLETLAARKMHTLKQLRESERRLAAIQGGVNLEYKEAAVPQITQGPQDPNLLQPPSLMDRFKSTGLGAALTEPGEVSPFGGPGPASPAAAREAQRQLYPMHPTPPVLTPGFKEPEPYKSQDEARPAGIKMPAPPPQQPAWQQQQPPLASPGTGMGPQSAAPMQMGGQQFAQAIPPPFFGEEPFDPRGLPNLGTGPEIRPKSIQDEYNKAKIQRGHGNTPVNPNEITAGALDISTMIAMLDEAMPFLSDEEVAALVRQNMQLA